MSTTVHKIYEQVIQDLPLPDRLKLATLILNNLVGENFLRNEPSAAETLSNSMEDFCLAQAMDEALQSPLLGREAALNFL
jgi:hypothetical protein